MIARFKASRAELDEIAERLDATPSQIRVAARRAIAQAAKWAHRQTVQNISGVTGIRARVVAGRARVDITDKKGRVWVGLSPIAPHRFGATQNSSGVNAGKFSFPKAFIVRGDGNLAGKVFKRRGKERLPIDRVEASIQKAAQIEVEAIAEATEGQFFKEFERQLKTLTSI